MSKLFVEEEDEMNGSDSDTSSQFHEAMEQPMEDDDPIIESIPLILNQVSDPKQMLHVLQYPGRAKTRPLCHDVYKSSIKPQSNFLQVKIPLDTSKFFNELKTEEWGQNIVDQCLDGVLDSSEEGMYVGQVVYDDLQLPPARRVVLLPVDGTGQLRPQFKYVDDVDNLNYAQRKADLFENKPTNIQILQSAAKPNTQMLNPEGGHNGALGEALKHIKKFEDEEWSSLTWKNTDSELVQNVKLQLKAADTTELVAKSTLDQYIATLIQ